MPIKHGVWHVSDPYGIQHAMLTRKAARLFAKQHGGARSGWRSNEYEYRRSVVRLRVALGFTEEAFGRLEAEPHTLAEDTTAKTLIAVWRLAYDRRDYKAASVFQNAFNLHEDYVRSLIDPLQYETRMRVVYLFALDNGYVDEDTAEQWMYHQ